MLGAGHSGPAKDPACGLRLTFMRLCREGAALGYGKGAQTPPEQLPLLEEGDLESPAPLLAAPEPPVADLPMPAEPEAQRRLVQVDPPFRFLQSLRLLGVCRQGVFTVRASLLLASVRYAPSLWPVF